MPRADRGRAAREANAAAQRRRRERMTEAQRDAERQRNAERYRQRRAAEDEAQADGDDRQRQRERERERREARRAADADRQRERRAAFGNEERAADADRQRERRAAFGEEERATDADRQRERRDAFGEEERAADADRQRERRAAFGDEEREEERNEAAERQRERRAAFDEEQREAERVANARARAEGRRRATGASRAACDATSVLSGRQQVAVHYSGLCDKACPHCGARLWNEERPTLCCLAGKVRLDPLPPPPPLLRELWTADTLDARTFRQHARQLNSALSLASQQVREVCPPRGGFTPCVVIQGRMYHRLGPLRAGEGETPTFAQIYVNDPHCDHPEEEAAVRLGHVRLPASTSVPMQLRLLDLLQNLQVMLRDINPWIQDFIHAAEMPEEMVQHMQLVISADARPADQHQRRYNRPEGFREVSVLIGDQPAHQDIVLHRRPGRDGPPLQVINETHRAMEPLHFILLLPWGTCGWNPALRQAVANPQGELRSLTARQYYAHRLQTRPDCDDSLLRACRLFQEYCCMAFARVETQRLLYVALNQTRIRAELYQRLQDALPGDPALGAAADPADVAMPIGTRVILPATFTGGPRYMQKRSVIRERDVAFQIIPTIISSTYQQIINGCLELKLRTIVK